MLPARLVSLPRLKSSLFLVKGLLSCLELVVASGSCWQTWNWTSLVGSALQYGPFHWLTHFPWSTCSAGPSSVFTWLRLNLTSLRFELPSPSDNRTSIRAVKTLVCAGRKQTGLQLRTSWSSACAVYNRKLHIWEPVRHFTFSSNVFTSVALDSSHHNSFPSTQFMPCKPSVGKGSQLPYWSNQLFRVVTAFPSTYAALAKSLEWFCNFAHLCTLRFPGS